MAKKNVFRDKMQACKGFPLLPPPLFTLFVFALIVNSLLSNRPILATEHAIEFPHPVAVAEIGFTRMIAFSSEASPASDRTFSCTVEDKTRLEVVGLARISAGRSLGFVRVRGIDAGETTLLIEGAPLKVRVLARRTPENRGRDTATIVSPTTGASVWGTIAIGVRVRMRPDESRTYGILLPDRRVLEPVEDSQKRFPPYRDLRFELDTTTFPIGTMDLVPIAIDADGHEIAGRPVRLSIIQPSPDRLTSGEAEAEYDVDRPSRFQDDRRHIGQDPKASGGEYFVNDGVNPALCFPVEVTSPGLHQVLLSVGGRRAQGVLPTVSIVVDGSSESVTNGRLVSESWHRLAIGIPFELGQGQHLITPYFVNDFWLPGLADRNLYIDAIEIAWVGKSADSIPSLPNDPYGLGPTPLSIALVRPLERALVAGFLEVEARCYWKDSQSSAAPKVTLRINDHPALSQQSGAPLFWVDGALLSEGKNRIELVAELSDGTTARTPIQTVELPEESGDESPRLHHRFSVHDKRWASDLRQRLTRDNRTKEKASAWLTSGQTATLALPESLEGEFYLFLEAIAESSENPARAAVSFSLEAEDQPDAHLNAVVHHWWQTRPCGEFRLPPGEKRLRIQADDSSIDSTRVGILSVVLVQKERTPDRTPPRIRILYPDNGTEVYSADILIFETWDHRSLASAELLIDDLRTSLTVDLKHGSGRVTLPLLLRDLEPGEHTIGVRVSDLSGNTVRSEPRQVFVLSQSPAKPTRYERAIHLLNRFAYGPSSDDLSAILCAADEEAWLRRHLTQAIEEPGDLAALACGFPLFAGRSAYEIPRRVLSHLLVTQNPVRARFVLWAQNHFSTWIRKIDGERKWKEHIAFSRIGAAPFDQLLLTSAQAPSMLAYLDQDSSFVGKTNENYAREIMELHTLGVDGGYTQEDVTSLTHLLTGWTASLEGDGRSGEQTLRTYTHRFDPTLNDGRKQSLLGYPFDSASLANRYDRTKQALELLAAHPSTSRFVSTKLSEHYAGFPADPQLVADLSNCFHETGGDLTEMLVMLAGHKAFWRQRSAKRLCQPIDYAMRLCRVTDHFKPWQIGEFLQRCGTGLFDRVTPDGYPEDDAAYGDSNALLQRWQFADRMHWALAQLIPANLRYRQELPENRWGDAVLDSVAIRITGRVLDDASHTAAEQLLASTSGNRDERSRAIAVFIAKLPEANLR